MFRRILSLNVILCFFLTTLTSNLQAHADSVLGLPTPGTMVNLSPAYEPVLMKGLKVHPENPILFDFIVDTGNSGLKADSVPLRNESKKIIKYFLASLTIPAGDLWVNLSPYEKDRIIPEQLGQTEMGRDMLAQDYMLKQLTASLIYPEKDLGKAFWGRVYSKAQQFYGTSNVPVNTFNKVWIVADKAKVYVHDNTAFVVSGHLKVMLEEDYLALEKNQRQPGDMFKQEQQRTCPQAGCQANQALNVKATQGNSLTHNVASQIVRQIVLPELEKEVNQGQNFSNLRQIFYSMILAAWYKKNLKEALLNQVYSNKTKINGVESQDKTIKERIYQEYLKAYKKGVFNFIREDTQTNGQMISRKYFSGGLAMKVGEVETEVSSTDPDAAMMIRHPVAAGTMFAVRTEASPQGFNKAMIARPLAEDVKDAWQATTPEEFISYMHNDYLVDSQGRLAALSNSLVETDPNFTAKIMEPEQIISSPWEEQRLVDRQGGEYMADVFTTRIANNSARGVPKGGLRGLFNYAVNNADDEKRTASDLMRDPAFRKAFTRLNELLRSSGESEEISKEHVKAFLQKWIEEEAKTLSMWMSFKTSVIGLPLGGGKGVFFIGQIRKNADGTFSIEDTQLWDDGNRENIARVTRGFVQMLYKAGRIGPDIDVPAPDKRTDGKAMGFATDEYIKLNMQVIQARDKELYDRLMAKKQAIEAAHEGQYPITSTALVEEANRYLHETHKPVPELAVFTGKNINHGGVVGRTEATGFGVESMTRALLESSEETVKGKTLAIQGAGNVALYEALQAIRDGLVLKVIGDQGVTLIKESGFTEQEILEFIRRFEDPDKKEFMYQCWPQIVKGSDVVAVLGEGDERSAAKERLAAILEADVDILSPSATEGVITGENASKVKAKYIVPGANGPITPEGLMILRKNKKIVVPDTLANARGVMVSFFEQVQALTGHIFTKEEVAQIGEQMHKAAFSVVWAESKRRKLPLTEAADIVAAQGIIRAQYLALIKKFDGDLKKMSEARGYGETEEQLREQIKSCGLYAYLQAIQNNSLAIRVVSKSDQDGLMDELKTANIIIAGSPAGGAVPYPISQHMLAQMGGGKLFIDPVRGPKGIIENGEGPRPTITSLRPAMIDERGNLIFNFSPLPAVFNGVASMRLAGATELLTEELVSGSLANDSGVRSGIVVAQGRLRIPAEPLTDDEFKKILELTEGKRSVGVPVERREGETRVGATPDEVERLVKLGINVFVERGAGARSGIPDHLYSNAGAQMVSRDEVWKADVIRKVIAPLAEEYQYLREGMILTSFLYLNRLDAEALRKALMAKKVTAIAYEEVQKEGYHPLFDRVFNLEGAGENGDDRERYILDPMSRVAGSVSAIWAALYYLRDGQYKKYTNTAGELEESIVKEKDVLLRRLLDDIRTHLQEFMNHSFGYPEGLMEEVGLHDRIGNVVVLGGSLVGRAAALDSLLLGAKRVTILVPSSEVAQLLRRQFRKDGLLRKEGNPADPKSLDRAQGSAKIAATEPPGGISLNSDNMQMDISGEKINIKFEQAMIANFKRGNFSGVAPIIIRITPITSPWPTSGINSVNEEALV